MNVLDLTPNQISLIQTALVVIGLIFLRWIFLRVYSQRTDDVRMLYRSRKVSAYAAAGLAVLVIGRIWFHIFTDLSTFLGLFSAGLAIALRDLVASFAGWVYLMWRKPFEVGDRVQVGEHAGDVIDIRLFRFTLLEIGNWVAADQSTGRVIHIPNSKILVDSVANYSKGFQYIWNEIPVLVTFESNWRKAKDILQEIAEVHAADLTEKAKESVRQAARQAMIFYTKMTPRVWTSVADSGVLLTVRYLCDPRKRRSSSERIWEDILEAFAGCEDIDFAYPTIRRYSNPEEGKPGTTPQPPELPQENS